MNQSKRLNLKRLMVALIIGVLSAVSFIALSHIEIFNAWEMKTYDLRMELARAERKVPENVVMFYVDEPSLRHMEAQGVNWPWPRELYASALDFCRRGGAKAVLFDLFFSEDSVYGVEDDEAFAAGVAAGPPSYFVIFLSESDPVEDGRRNEIIRKSFVPFDPSGIALLPKENSIISLPINPLVNAATGFGNAQVPPDHDGVYRRVSLISRIDATPVPLIALKVAGDFKEIKNLSMPSANLLILDSEEIPLDESGEMMINYYGGVGTFSSYSLAAIMASDMSLQSGNRPDISPAVVKDKIIIIGLSAPGLYDMKSTPFSRTYPGPEILATLVENIMTGDFLTPMSKWSGVLITMAAAITAALGLVLISSSWGTALWLIFILSLLAGGDTLAFKNGAWLPFIAPFGAFALSAFATTLYNFMTEGRKKRDIRRAFGQYLSPHVVSKIAEHPESLKLGGEQREITILFSDIADFTTISEQTQPEELVLKLNEYFGTTTRIIHEHSGTLDKYIGDAIMAFWGAPLSISDHATPAVTAAMKIQEILAGGSSFKTRIGIHTGNVIVGNIGSDIRFNYTAIGDSVNLASRLEGLNKKFGTRIIISETTFKKMSGPAKARRIGRVRVKGRVEPIGIFEPLETTGHAERFEDALIAFENASFDAAGKLFAKLFLEDNDPVSAYYGKLCKELILKTPENFDGVINFDTK